MTLAVALALVIGVLAGVKYGGEGAQPPPHINVENNCEVNVNERAE